MNVKKLAQSRIRVLALWAGPKRPKDSLIGEVDLEDNDDRTDASEAIDSVSEEEQ